MKCPKCEKPVPERDGPGRPRRYCSDGCRRSAEYELRRIQRALESVEEQIRWCRFGWSGRRPDDEAKYEEERQRLEARLLVLVDDEETDT